MPKIGFIGLGHMGTPMVKRLLAHGFQVTVYDILENAVKNLVSLGAVAAQSPAETAQNVDVVFTMLQTGAQVKACCVGDQGIFSHMKKDVLFVDTSSIDIQTSRELHQLASSQGLVMFDAPVSGGAIGAENGLLTFMVGCEEKYFEKVQPFLSAMGKRIIHAGVPGNGVAAKICNNMILGISVIAVSEAFVLADQLGLSPEKLFEISSNASGQCWVLNNCCPWPNILPNAPSSHDYQPAFSAKMMLKDLLLSQAAADAIRIETPLGKHATALYQTFVDSQLSDIDFTGILKMLRTPVN